ncbi:hypothetical protein M5E06_15065 [Azospirillum sp. A1-3]|uniref:hypothetical protein n=1 Tax=Azospirillum sp. A1-3 TaxID=185874 RepID=UPI002076EF77|nr:hypothetical protein [Azospirillum sp. A1-3]MCM8735479.1 hypothetical protein [Azospirillum sp. A1-3]
MTVRQVVELASVNVNTVTRIEKGHPALYDTLQKIRTAPSSSAATEFGFIADRALQWFTVGQ